MKNPIIRILTTLLFVFSSYLYAADDHEQHDDQIDHEDKSSENHDASHDRNEHTDDNETEENTKGGK